MYIGPSQLSCRGSSVVEHSVWSVECRGFESHLRQLIFLRKSDCLGCAVLLCLVVCLTSFASFSLLSSLIKRCTCASFFLPFASLLNMHVHVHVETGDTSAVGM